MCHMAALSLLTASNCNKFNNAYSDVLVHAAIVFVSMTAYKTHTFCACRFHQCKCVSSLSENNVNAQENTKESTFYWQHIPCLSTNSAQLCGQWQSACSRLLLCDDRGEIVCGTFCLWQLTKIINTVHWYIYSYTRWTLHFSATACWRVLLQSVCLPRLVSEHACLKTVLCHECVNCTCNLYTSIQSHLSSLTYLTASKPSYWCLCWSVILDHSLHHSFISQAVSRLWLIHKPVSTTRSKLPRASICGTVVWHWLQPSSTLCTGDKSVSKCPGCMFRVLKFTDHPR